MTTAPNDEVVDILLVDDRAENLLALEAILEPLGQRLVRAQSGEHALRCLLDREFAVILLDVQMPGMNGFETARMIKSRERTKFIPIIFVTAISKEDEYVFHGYSVGAVDYIFKPFQPEILRSKVQVFVELRRQQRRIAQQEQRLRDVERQELELKHTLELLEAEARQASTLAESAKELKQLNDELHRRQLELERAMTARSRFYASMSHELRTLTLELKSSQPIEIMSDPRRLRQILLNLLSNAIKFGRGRPIDVVVSSTDDVGVAISVTDHGDGISKADQERIFHEFVQLGKTQLQDGTGLGLPISRRLAELLRGSLTVESVPGEGSTFKLQLPPGWEGGRTLRIPDQEIREASDERELSGARVSNSSGRRHSPISTRAG